MSRSVDFEKVKAAALSNIDSVLSHWLPGGTREGSEYVALNPTRNDSKKGSFSVNMTTGVWSDFATGDNGDIIHLIAYIEGSGDLDACKKLSSFLSVNQDTVPTQAPATKLQRIEVSPLFPVPKNQVGKAPRAHPELGRPSQTWEYLNQNGELLMKVMRFDITNSNERPKTYRPLVFFNNGRWRWKQAAANRPLYGLETLKNFPLASVVLLCEGEKATDSARLLFPELPVLTWPGGSKAISNADFSPLSGRTIWYWPDNDEVGEESIGKLSQALFKAGIAKVIPLKLSVFNEYKPLGENGSAGLGHSETPFPNKADAYDAYKIGWRSNHMERLLALSKLLGPAIQPEQNLVNTSEQASLRNYKTDSSGLYYYDSRAERYNRVGARLEVLAKSRNIENRGWGTLVSFVDLDGVVREWNIPAAHFAKEGGSEIISGLLDRGYYLKTSREAKKRLIEYLGDFDTKNRVRLVERLGWFGDAFLLPDQIIGSPPELLHYYSEGNSVCKISQNKAVTDWVSSISRYCQNNSLPTLSICSAFAAPLLNILNYEPCGFHFVGDSSLGKSTLLNIAASVYGKPKDYVKSWRATDNALEATAAAHSDCLLPLDEIGQIDPRIVGETVYMLGNGEGKSRANEQGRSRGVEHRWRLVFLSSGEKTLQDHMGEAGRKPQAGMEARLLTIPANLHNDREKRLRLGIYEDTHTFTDGASLSEHFNSHCNSVYGSVLVEYLNEISKSEVKEKVISKVARLRNNFADSLTDSNSSGQVRRAADKFALLAAAGEMATQFNLTGWESGWATSAAKNCFRAWLSQRGGTGSLEDNQAIEHVRSMINKFGESRFTRWEKDAAKIDEHGPRTLERWGFRKTSETQEFAGETTTENVFYLTRSGFKDMCPALDIKRVARLLAELGALDTDKEPGRLTKKTRLPGVGKNAVNCYVLRASALFGDSSAKAPEA